MAPTLLDRLTNSKNAFLAFAGIIVGVSAWAVWRDDPLFRGNPDDPLGDPEGWTISQLREWLEARGLEPSDSATKEGLVERVKVNIKKPRERRPSV